jgi:serine/threonine protein kinase
MTLKRIYSALVSSSSLCNLILTYLLNRLTGRPAFPGNNLIEIINKNKAGDI